MARNITRFADRTFFHTVDLSLLERLLQQCDVEVGELPADQTDRADALFDIFYRADEGSLNLHEALYSIMRLDNHNGMSLLIDLAQKEETQIETPRQAEAGGDPPPVTPRHLALKAYLDHRDIFNAALDMLAFLLPRAPLEWQGLEENVRPSSDDEAGRSAFRDAVSKYLQSRYRGDFCDVKWLGEPDELDVLVEHGKSLQTILRERMGKAEPLTFHELRTATLRYDADIGFLKVTGEDDRDKQKLKDLFATHVLKRPKFFDHADSENLYTLDPVARAGPGFVLHNGADDSLVRWAIQEIQFDEGERWQGRRRRRPRWRQTFWHVSNAVAHLGECMPDLDWRAVRFTYMKIWLEFLLDGRTRPALVTVKPPRILRGPQGKLEPRIRDFLQHNGISRPRGPRPATPGTD
jgi:hypothetical protein